MTPNRIRVPKSRVAEALWSGVFSIIVVLLVFGLAGSLAAQTPVYNSIPSGMLNIPPTIPGHVAAEGFECCQVQEFGDGVNLAPGPRFLTIVKVEMDSYACSVGAYNIPFGTSRHLRYAN